MSTASRQVQRGPQHDTLRGADRGDRQEPGGSQHPLVHPQRQQDARPGIHGHQTCKEQLKAFLREALDEVVT